ncbi:adhesion G-protein coupled receptor G7 isoform X2 [Hyperolius riggenbachi]
MYGYSVETCEEGTVNAGTPKATIQCVNNGGNLTLGLPRIQNCDQNLETLANKTAIENPEEVAATTQILTSDPTNLQSDNITNAMRIVTRLLQNATEDVGQSAVATVSQILSANTTEFQSVNVSEAESLTKEMESYSVSTGNDTVSVVQPSVAVEKRTLPARSQNGISFLALRGLSDGDDLITNRIIIDNNTSEFALNETADVQLFIKPAENSNIDAAVGFVLYQNDNLFSSKHKRSLEYRKKIISASISNEIRANVEFSFSQRVNTSFILTQYACVYWDYDKGEWSTKNCGKVTEGLIRINGTMLLRCTCNHTTNFAVLMKFRENITHPALDIVSTTGCALSMAGLAVTVVFLLYASFRKKQKVSWILMSLCTAMLIFYVVFIAAVKYPSNKETDETSNPLNTFLQTDLDDFQDGVCTTLAVLLHYFLLATFVLTAMLAAEFCVRLIHVSFVSPHYFIRSALITGWGLPAIIVLITFAATYIGENNYHRKEYCWLAGEDEENKLDLKKPMLWSFLVPAGIILVTNIGIVIAVAVLSIWKENPSLPSTKKNSIIKKTLSTFSVATLLGVTWVIGYLMLLETNETTQIIFSFIFCICCATQGLQIFLFYTLRSRLFLQKVAVVVQLFNACKIRMHSKKYWVNRIRKQTNVQHERFINLSESRAQLFSDSKEFEA